MSTFLDTKLFFLTHHKCGSGWFNGINFEIFRALGRVAYVLNDNDTSYLSANDFYSDNKAGFVAFNNADSSFIDLDDQFRAIHVVRDPRDIIVSAYYSHKNTHPLYDSSEGRALEHHRKILSRLNLEDGLLAEIDYSKRWYLDKLCELSSCSSDKIKRLKLEDISKNNVEAYLEVLRHFEIDVVEKNLSAQMRAKINRVIVPLSRRGFLARPAFSDKIDMATLHHILDNNAWTKRSGGRAKGDINEDSHYRSGVPGEWRKCFTDRVSARFNERFPELIQRLNYIES